MLRQWLEPKLRLQLGEEPRLFENRSNTVKGRLWIPLKCAGKIYNLLDRRYATGPLHQQPSIHQERHRKANRGVVQIDRLSDVDVRDGVFGGPAMSTKRPNDLKLLG